MKTFKLIPTETVSEITCDCCTARFTANDAGWFEIQSIEFVAGYSSIFGDGNAISIDLCQDCLKQNLGQWLRVEKEQPRVIDDEALLKSLIKALHQSVGRAHASIDDTARFVEESNHRIEAMEKSGRRLGSREDTHEVTGNFDAPLPGSIQQELHEPENLAPPPGYQSWLHYAVETMEARSLEIEGVFDVRAEHQEKAVSREEMRAAAQMELRKLLKGSVLKYEDPTEPIDLVSTTERIENLKGMLHKPDAPVSIDDMGMVDGLKYQNMLREEWNTGPPVGCEFGADSARFTRVLQRAISVFGNPLEAIQWLTTFNLVVGGEPMKSVIGSEEECKHVMAILSAIETGGVTWQRQSSEPEL